MYKKIRYIGSLLAFSFFNLAQAKELLIATSFSPETMNYIQQEWKDIYPDQNIRLINRTVSSLERLLTQPNIENVDLVMSSSPFLFEKLQQQQYLLPLSKNLQHNDKWVPTQLKQTTTAIAFSGYGIFYNKKLLNDRHLPMPTDWESLFHPHYFNGVLVSSPSRSGSNHIMLEMLLQQRGWKQGWEDFLTLSSNLSLISSRSFNVADKVKAGLAVAGISIDTYALNQPAHSDVDFTYFPHSIASPTFLAIHRNSENTQEAIAFIEFLLSEKGQQMVATHNFAKYPLTSLNQQDPLYSEQQKLLEEPLLNYDLLLAREHLVKKLFDSAITFRLAQLKEAWGILKHKEEVLGKQLPNLRAELTEMPITPEQANDKVFLDMFKTNRSFALAQERKWAEFFQTQINKVLIAIEEH
ncbi:ABC transporter substrate-binding protein [Mannheimia sp. AT1]|uniref:ABC transporter substrate-binding protein n=1 Tax=Mannheimia cairinae TaxID=3025936 RepID=A0ABT5MPF2_9PAST|nr:ABC transporter substrate-binding protein [Mannheimia cairinae]MDD0823371.1 ABC transporter substrate-binding protein [Mannheimia cairinae]MDD0827021.1 ABC transporter substrate-binding protein [Mannheimia cairinae]